MKHIVRIILPLAVIIIFVNLYFANPTGIQPVDGYPVWMKDASGRQTNQTSGLFYAGEKDGMKIFVGADDIGKINRIAIDERVSPPELTINEIVYSDEVHSLLKKFKKSDMEDISFDKKNNKIYISIEGHEYNPEYPEMYKQKEGIYETTFNKDILTFDTLLTIRKLEFPKELYSYTYDNIGFEGLAVTDNYFFLGLENFQITEAMFSDSTILYVFNRKTKELKSLGTRDLKISTICGLYAADDYNLYGIDRNRRSMFYIKFNPDFTVQHFEIREMNLCIPFHKDINSVIGIAAESITFDNEGKIYVAVDPWKELYKPDITDRRKLTSEEMENFNNLTPILYKFNNEFQ